MSGSDKQERLKKAMAEGKLQELRRILTGFDHSDLDRLNRFLQDPEAFSNEIASLLPRAVVTLLERGEIKHRDLQPLVEEALKESVRKNPHTLSDILFPIMMPAIRKAVAEDIKRMLDSVNNTLEHSFSPKRIGWRFQALFSGRSYAEIALSHAYIYHVKQVFLIHKETGLLLHQVNETGNESQNADMVSSMLSAIKDFVQDSFKTGEDSELQTLKIGNLNILIEQGPYAIIAAVIEGNVPGQYKVLLKETIEKVHITYSYELEHFEGDISPFQLDDNLLKQCLQKEKKEEKPKKPVLAILLLILILAALGYLLYGYADTRIRFHNLVHDINNKAGLVVTDKGKHWFGKYYIYGLRDPHAVNPKALVAASGMDTSHLIIWFKPYFSPSPKFVLFRAKKLLQPPQTVQLFYKNEKLIIKGMADSTWIAQAKERWPLIAGVSGIDLKVSNLKKPMTKKEKKKKVKRNILSIEKHTFTFEYNVFELSEQQRKEFDNLIKEVKNVLNFSFNQDSVPVIIINSFTSYDGNTEANKIVAQHRAEQFVNMMIEEGIPMETLVPKVRFIEDINNKYPIRTVTFKVKYIKPEDL